jgi:hypothetical protein
MFLGRLIKEVKGCVVYMPIVIEQLVLGVSCSLDIGPCVKWVVAMADERDSHNPVTELLRYAQQHMRSGAAIDEPILEVARLSGHTELTHVFMSLAQVTRHGGEITKQLQELANAVTAQRGARIEGKIKKDRQTTIKQAFGKTEDPEVTCRQHEAITERRSEN